MRRSVKKRSLVLALFAVFAAFLSIIVGGRDLSVGADTPGYARHYEQQASCFCFTGMEPGFELLTMPAAVATVGVSGYFIYLSLLVFAMTFAVINRLEAMYAGHRRALGYFVAILGLAGVFLANPLYLQIHINAIRHGISAIAVALFVLSLVQRKSRAHTVFWAAASIFVHWSAAMYVPLAWVAASGKFIRLPLLLVILHVFQALYVLGYSESLVAYLSPPLHEFVFNYGESALGRYGFGPRVDFAIFTYVLAVAGVLLSKRSGLRSMSLIASAAALSTVPFYILGWGVFSNRYLFTPWILFSVLAAALYVRFVIPSKLGPLASVAAFFIGAVVFIAGVM